MARLVAILLCVIVAACAPVSALRGPLDTTPAISDESFTTRDGLALPLRHWDAVEPRAVIVALHGMNDYSNAFAMPAPFWAEHGITTYAYDQRGFGAAPNKGLWAGEAALTGDLADCVAAVRMRHPGVPVFVLGESMGGAVVLTAYASSHPPQGDGIILVSPAVWSRADMPFHYRAALWLTAHLMPGLTVSGRGVVKIWPSDNIEMLKKFSRDPLVIKLTRTDAVWGLVNLMDDARIATAKLAAPPPILLLHGEKDQVIPPASAAAAVKNLGTKAEERLYPKGYHMLLRDLEGPAVWADIVAWIDSRLTAAAKPR